MAFPVNILAACLIGIAMGLFGLNFWHTSRCASSIQLSQQQIDDLVKALNRRVLQAESQAISDGILLDRVINLMQARLQKFETSELRKITDQAKDEAVRLALMLEAHPAPPMPEFDLDPQYKDAENLADAIDDVLRRSDADMAGSESVHYGSSYLDSSEVQGAKEKSVTITDAEATKICTEWKVNYSVVTGVSWGNLPYDLQQKWLKYSCDYHLDDKSDKDNAKASSSSTGTHSSKDDRYEEDDRA